MVNTKNELESNSEYRNSFLRPKNGLLALLSDTLALAIMGFTNWPPSQVSPWTTTRVKEQFSGRNLAPSTYMSTPSPLLNSKGIVFQEGLWMNGHSPSSGGGVAFFTGG